MASNLFCAYSEDMRAEELKKQGLVCPIARRWHFVTAEEAAANRMLLEPMPMPELESDSDSDSDGGPLPLVFRDDEMYKLDKLDRLRNFEFSRLFFE